ncbi:MAG: hypothetical protein AAFO75_11730, partial [Pseudomonadota bacterium]
MIQMVGLISSDSETAPLLLVGIALVVAIPVLVLVGMVFRSVAGGSAPRNVVDAALSEAGSHKVRADAETQTIVEPSATSDAPPEPRKVTTQALRSPPRAGPAKIV